MSSTVIGIIAQIPIGRASKTKAMNQDHCLPKFASKCGLNVVNFGYQKELYFTFRSQRTKSFEVKLYGDFCGCKLPSRLHTAQL